MSKKNFLPPPPLLKSHSTEIFTQIITLIVGNDLLCQSMTKIWIHFFLAYKMYKRIFVFIVSLINEKFIHLSTSLISTVRTQTLKMSHMNHIFIKKAV